MKHARIYSIFVLSLLCAGVNAFAQSPDIASAFETYKSKFNASRLYLTFNQPFYAPADTIFFSAWHLDEAHKLMPGRQVASLDLIEENGHAIKRIHFRVEGGRAANQLVLPKDFPPGSYTVVAYTDWMRNFSQDWFFQKRIEVKGRNEITPALAPITAGVEGGSLVAGIVNHVVVAADYPGALISIRSQSGEEVASVALDSTGVATANITPRAGTQYTAHGPANSKVQLPAVKENGVSIGLSRNNETFLVSVSEQLRSTNLTAVFTSAGKIVDIRRLVLEDGNATINMPSMLRGLFHQLYIFDAKGIVVGERVFAKGTSQDAGTLAGSADVFQRQNITLTIDLPAAADLNITAYQQKLFNTHTLKQGFYLSELPAVLQWAERYPKYESTLNTFLVTQHWPRINWTEIFSGESKKIAFPYYSILSEKGQVRSRTTGQPVPDSTNVIVYLQKNTMGYDTYTRDGRFEVPFAFDFWETDYLFVTLQRKSRDLGPDYEVVIDPDSIQLPPIAKGKQLATESPYGNYAFNKQLISNSYSFFAKDVKNTEADRGPNAVFEDELGELNYEVDVEKYVVFPTMEDLLREVVPFVQYRKKGMAEGVRMLFRYNNNSTLSKSNPLYVVDGVMTRNSDFFMSLKPKDLLTVKIANDPNRLQQLGKIGTNGIVLIESKKRTLGDSLRQASNIPVTGLNPVLPFHNITEAKATASQRVPDLRSTLFWQGKGSTDNTGRQQVTFVSGDDVGPIKVIIQGLTPDGVPIYLERDVNVKFQRQQ